MSGPARKGISPWQDAWRRLRKNKMAMFGLGVVILMSLAAIGAGVLAPFDAKYGFSWIGAKGPGYTHPHVLNKNVLAVGAEPEIPARYKRASSLTIEVNRRDERILQVEFERRRKGETNKGRVILRIKNGGQEVPYPLEVTGDEYLIVYSPLGRPGKPLRDLTLDRGMPAPVEVFGENPPRRVTVHVGREVPSNWYKAKLDGGKVVELTKDREPVERVELGGNVIRSFQVDGRPRTVSHLLGTDLQGRDLYSRILFGARISLLVGLLATAVSLLIGVVYGAFSGYVGGKTDLFLMGVVDVLYGIPYMFLVILLLVNFGRDIKMLFIALGAVQWLTMARIVRGQVLSLKEKEFIEAARMCGTSHSGILFGHLIPNTLGVVVVYTTLTVPAVILQESFLAFIGLAVTYQGQNLDSWGALVKAGADALGAGGNRWWLLIFPSLAMALTLFSLNFLGDGLRDALDPQQRGRT